jgi:hypothetical protein
MEMIHVEDNIRIMLDTAEKNKYKMVMEFTNPSPNSCEFIFTAICNPEFELAYNDNIAETSVKTLVASENSAIMYMTLKPFSRIYRARDFVFIRHAFCSGKDALYIADKNIENTNFPPFITIVRGGYECVWAILRKRDKIRVIGDIYMDNKGDLNENQNSNLVLNYLLGYKKLPVFIQKNGERLSQYMLFDSNWDITKSKQN